MFHFQYTSFKALTLLTLLQLPIDTVLDQVLEAPGLQEWFDGAIEGGNPDALLLALKIREKISIDHKVFCKILPDQYSSSKLFAVDYLTSLANCLKVVSKFIFMIRYFSQ